MVGTPGPCGKEKKKERETGKRVDILGPCRNKYAVDAEINHHTPFPIHPAKRKCPRASRGSVKASGAALGSK